MDFFDEIASKRRDVFDEVESDRIGDKIFDEVEKELPSLVRSYVKKQTQKFKTLSPKEISDLVDAAISSIPPQNHIEKVIEKRIVVTPPKDSKKYAEESEVKELKEEIEKLRKKLADVKSETYIIGGGAGIPNYSSSQGRFLTNDGNQMSWGTPVGSVSSEVYTPTNVTTRRTIDANDTSLDEIADLLGTLIIDLRIAGIVQ